MNNINLTGRLTRDPELVHAKDRAICRMRVAVEGNEKYPTTFLDVTTFDGHAYACAEFLHKGRRVAVDGKLAYSEWQDKDGKRRERYQVIGRVEFLDAPPRRQRPPEPADPELKAPGGEAKEPKPTLLAA
jgi:single-strand DNA-binding protein